MQLVLVGGFDAGNFEPGQQPPQLAGGQAGADDRAMQAVMQVPNLGSASRRGGRSGDEVARGRRIEGNGGMALCRRPERGAAGLEYARQQQGLAGGRHGTRYIHKNIASVAQLVLGEKGGPTPSSWHPPISRAPVESVQAA